MYFVVVQHPLLASSCGCCQMVAGAGVISGGNGLGCWNGLFTPKSGSGLGWQAQLKTGQVHMCTCSDPLSPLPPISFSLSLSQQPSLHKVGMVFLVAWQSQNLSYKEAQGSQQHVQGAQGESCKTPCDSLHSHAASLVGPTGRPAQIQWRVVWLVRKRLWRPATTVSNFTDEETDPPRSESILWGLCTKGFEFRVRVLSTWVNLGKITVSLVLTLHGNDEIGGDDIEGTLDFSQPLSLWI